LPGLLVLLVRRLVFTECLGVRSLFSRYAPYPLAYLIIGFAVGIPGNIHILVQPGLEVIVEQGLSALVFSL
jgi:hypothetical protein